MNAPKSALTVLTFETPNPQALRFVFQGAPELCPANLHFAKADANSGVPLIDGLLAINGVASAYVGPDFLTVSKADPETDWFELTPAIREVIRREFRRDMFQNPELIERYGVARPDSADGELNEWFARVVLPATEKDGGGLYLRGAENGELVVEARGACRGCPYLNETLTKGVFEPLRETRPELSGVKVV